MGITLFLLILAVICWFLAAISYPKTGLISLGWLGLFFYGLSLLLK